MSNADNAAGLEALAVGLCQDADIRLEVTPRPTWAWDPIRRVIIVSQADLLEKGPEFCAGVLAHEIGHFYITRYSWFSVPFPSAPILHFLLNAIEDPRVNTWMKRRYPGCDPWMGRVAELEMSEYHPEPRPRLVEFGFEAAREGWLDWQAPPEGAVSLEVAAALEETRAARRQFAETLPPVDLSVALSEHELAVRYRDEVWPRLSSRASRVMPSPREQGVRLSVLESLKLAEEKILPIALKLLEDDIERTAAYLRDNPEAQQQASDALHGGDAGKVRDVTQQAAQHQSAEGAAEPRMELRSMSLGLMEALLESMNQQDRNSPLSDEEGDSGRARRFVSRPGEKRNQRRRPVRRGQRKPPMQGRPGGEGAGGIASAVQSSGNSYDQALMRVARQVNYLARVIEEELRPAKRLRERRGYPSGFKLDVRRLMAFHADFKDYDKLWMRKTVPDRWNVVFSLLVDLSGSMDGEKILATTAGTVLLVETLHRLNVPFLVNGFHDVLVPFCDINEGLTTTVRQAIGEMPQRITGGTELAPCLRQVAEDVLALDGYNERLLVVITDGMPNSAEDLSELVSQLLPLEPELKLVALGLGPETEQVKDFFPEAKVNLPVDRLGVEIGDLLRRKLRAGGRRGLNRP